jgi:hypothetical protein
MKVHLVSHPPVHQACHGSFRRVPGDNATRVRVSPPVKLEQPSQAQRQIIGVSQALGNEPVFWPVIKQDICFDRHVEQRMLLPFPFPSLTATTKLELLGRQHRHQELSPHAPAGVWRTSGAKRLFMSSAIQSG